MQTLDKDDFRTILEDARARHAAVVALIYFNDTQAMNLLRLYLTVGVATLSGAIAALTKDTVIPIATGWALAATTGVMLFGSILCLLAMASGTINLPGRDADFWLWGLDPQVEKTDVLKRYLENLKEKAETNRGLTERSGIALKYAKYCVVAAIIAAACAGALALRLKS